MLDINTVISAVISRARPSSATRLAVDRAYGGASEVLVCPRWLEEFEGVLRRPWMRAYLPLEAVPSVEAWVLGASRSVADPASIEAVCRDPDDDYLIALARAHDATIVSGDADLVSLRESSAVWILTPREYLETG